ncbi:hypothetical protein NDU88_001628 [Pleurodeles waltl]|uniref:Uncharacterized protein n=1 Tax=Pleurodeles waltl TaxID=8319 RepID=A0AAV7Q9C7_PLEWA|nr:hypothetical protein NDU88_001628 [Pleurodeles waltl]
MDLTLARLRCASCAPAAQTCFQAVYEACHPRGVAESEMWLSASTIKTSGKSKTSTVDSGEEMLWANRGILIIPYRSVLSEAGRDGVESIACSPCWRKPSKFIVA